MDNHNTNSFFEKENTKVNEELQKIIVKLSTNQEIGASRVSYIEKSLENVFDEFNNQKPFVNQCESFIKKGDTSINKVNEKLEVLLDKVETLEDKNSQLENKLIEIVEKIETESNLCQTLSDTHSPDTTSCFLQLPRPTKNNIEKKLEFSTNFNTAIINEPLSVKDTTFAASLITMEANKADNPNNFPLNNLLTNVSSNEHSSEGASHIPDGKNIEESKSFYTSFSVVVPNSTCSSSSSSSSVSPLPPYLLPQSIHSNIVVDSTCSVDNFEINERQKIPNWTINSKLSTEDSLLVMNSKLNSIKENKNKDYNDMLLEGSNIVSGISNELEEIKREISIQQGITKSENIDKDSRERRQKHEHVHENNINRLTTVQAEEDDNNSNKLKDVNESGTIPKTPLKKNLSILETTKSYSQMCEKSSENIGNIDATPNKNNLIENSNSVRNIKDQQRTSTIKGNETIVKDNKNINVINETMIYSLNEKSETNQNNEGVYISDINAVIPKLPNPEIKIQSVEFIKNELTDSTICESKVKQKKNKNKDQVREITEEYTHTKGKYVVDDKCDTELFSQNKDLVTEVENNCISKNETFAIYDSSDDALLNQNKDLFTEVEQKCTSKTESLNVENKSTTVINKTDKIEYLNYQLSSETKNEFVMQSKFKEGSKAQKDSVLPPVVDIKVSRVSESKSKDQPILITADDELCNETITQHEYQTIITSKTFNENKIDINNRNKKDIKEVVVNDNFTENKGLSFVAELGAKISPEPKSINKEFVHIAVHDMEDIHNIVNEQSNASSSVNSDSLIKSDLKDNTNNINTLAQNEGIKTLEESIENKDLPPVLLSESVYASENVLDCNAKIQLVKTNKSVSPFEKIAKNKSTNKTKVNKQYDVDNISLKSNSLLSSDETLIETDPSSSTLHVINKNVSLDSNQDHSSLNNYVINQTESSLITSKDVLLVEKKLNEDCQRINETTTPLEDNTFEVQPLADVKIIDKEINNQQILIDSSDNKQGSKNCNNESDLKGNSIADTCNKIQNRESHTKIAMNKNKNMNNISNIDNTNKSTEIIQNESTEEITYKNKMTRKMRHNKDQIHEVKTEQNHENETSDNFETITKSITNKSVDLSTCNLNKDKMTKDLDKEMKLKGRNTAEEVIAVNEVVKNMTENNKSVSNCETILSKDNKELEESKCIPVSTKEEQKSEIDFKSKKEDSPHVKIDNNNLNVITKEEKKTEIDFKSKKENSLNIKIDISEPTSLFEAETSIFSDTDTMNEQLYTYDKDLYNSQTLIESAVDKQDIAHYRSDGNSLLLKSNSKVNNTDIPDLIKRQQKQTTIEMENITTNELNNKGKNSKKELDIKVKNTEKELDIKVKNTEKELNTKGKNNENKLDIKVKNTEKELNTKGKNTKKELETDGKNSGKQLNTKGKNTENVVIGEVAIQTDDTSKKVLTEAAKEKSNPSTKIKNRQVSEIKKQPKGKKETLNIDAIEETNKSITTRTDNVEKLNSNIPQISMESNKSQLGGHNNILQNECLSNVVSDYKVTKFTDCVFKENKLSDVSQDLKESSSGSHQADDLNKVIEEKKSEIVMVHEIEHLTSVNLDISKTSNPNNSQKKEKEMKIEFKENQDVNKSPIKRKSKSKVSCDDMKQSVNRTQNQLENETKNKKTQGNQCQISEVKEEHRNINTSLETNTQTITEITTTTITNNKANKAKSNSQFILENKKETKKKSKQNDFDDVQKHPIKFSPESDDAKIPKNSFKNNQVLLEDGSHSTKDNIDVTHKTSNKTKTDSRIKPNNDINDIVDAIKLKVDSTHTPKCEKSVSVNEQETISDEKEVCVPTDDSGPTEETKSVDITGKSNFVLEIDYTTKLQRGTYANVVSLHNSPIKKEIQIKVNDDGVNNSNKSSNKAKVDQINATTFSSSLIQVKKPITTQRNKPVTTQLNKPIKTNVKKSTKFEVNEPMKMEKQSTNITNVDASVETNVDASVETNVDASVETNSEEQFIQINKKKKKFWDFDKNKIKYGPKSYIEANKESGFKERKKYNNDKETPIARRKQLYEGNNSTIEQRQRRGKLYTQRYETEKNLKTDLTLKEFNPVQKDSTKMSKTNKFANKIGTDWKLLRRKKYFKSKTNEDKIKNTNSKLEIQNNETSKSDIVIPIETPIDGSNLPAKLSESELLISCQSIEKEIKSAEIPTMSRKLLYSQVLTGIINNSTFEIDGTFGYSLDHNKCFETLEDSVDDNTNLDISKENNNDEQQCVNNCVIENTFNTQDQIKTVNISEIVIADKVNNKLDVEINKNSKHFEDNEKLIIKSENICLSETICTTNISEQVVTDGVKQKQRQKRKSFYSKAERNSNNDNRPDRNISHEITTEVNKTNLIDNMNSENIPKHTKKPVKHMKEKSMQEQISEKLEGSITLNEHKTPTEMLNQPISLKTYIANSPIENIEVSVEESNIGKVPYNKDGKDTLDELVIKTKTQKQKQKRKRYYSKDKLDSDIPLISKTEFVNDKKTENLNNIISSEDKKDLSKSIQSKPDNLNNKDMAQNLKTKQKDKNTLANVASITEDRNIIQSTTLNNAFNVKTPKTPMHDIDQKEKVQRKIKNSLEKSNDLPVPREINKTAKIMTDIETLSKETNSNKSNESKLSRKERKHLNSQNKTNSSFSDINLSEETDRKIQATGNLKNKNERIIPGDKTTDESQHTLDAKNDLKKAIDQKSVFDNRKNKNVKKNKQTEIKHSISEVGQPDKVDKVNINRNKPISINTEFLSNGSPEEKATSFESNQQETDHNKTKHTTTVEKSANSSLQLIKNIDEDICSSSSFMTEISSTIKSYSIQDPPLSFISNDCANELDDEDDEDEMPELSSIEMESVINNDTFTVSDCKSDVELYPESNTKTAERLSQEEIVSTDANLKLASDNSISISIDDMEFIDMEQLKHEACDSVLEHSDDNTATPTSFNFPEANTLDVQKNLSELAKSSSEKVVLFSTICHSNNDSGIDEQQGSEQTPATVKNNIKEFKTTELSSMILQEPENDLCETFSNVDADKTEIQDNASETRIDKKDDIHLLSSNDNELVSSNGHGIPNEDDIESNKKETEIIVPVIENPNIIEEQCSIETEFQEECVMSSTEPSVRAKTKTQQNKEKQKKKNKTSTEITEVGVCANSTADCSQSPVNENIEINNRCENIDKDLYNVNLVSNGSEGDSGLEKSQPSSVPVSSSLNTQKHTQKTKPARMSEDTKTDAPVAGAGPALAGPIGASNMQVEEAGMCANCGMAATQRCANCRQVFYCMKECQGAHWKSTHREECKPFMIVNTSDLGRHCIATRDLKAGDLIFKDEPFVIGPKQITEPVCLGCYRTVDGAYRCPKCSWPLCGPQCEDSVDHQAECVIGQQIGSPIDIKNFKETNHFYEVVMPLRCLALKKKAPKKYEKMLTLQSHYEDRKGTHVYDENQKRVVNMLRNYFMLVDFPPEILDCSEYLIHKITGIIDVNALEIRLPESDILGLFQLFAMLEHSCTPNTKHTFNRKNQAIVRAAVEIKKGEHLSTMYTHILWGTAARRDHLKTNKYFMCTCRRCTDPTEFGTHFSALRCQGCPMGYLMSAAPLDEQASWICTSCNFTMPSNEVNELTLHLGEEVESALANPTLKELEDLIEKYSATSVHPNHFHLFSPRHTLLQLYGRDEAGLNEVSVKKKEKLCQEFLKTCTALDPGMSRLAPYAGVALYEYHVAVMARARKAPESGTPDHAAITKDFLTAKALLHQCINVLQHEPDDQPEAQLRNLAQQNLAELQSWDAAKV